MFWRRIPVVLCLVTLFVSGCSSTPTDALVGEYSSKSGGSAELKIAKEGDKYLLMERKGDGWSEGVAMVACDDSFYSQIFGEKWKDAEPMALRVEGGSLFVAKVKQGASVGGRTFNTGYYMFLNMLMQGDVYKL